MLVNTKERIEVRLKVNKMADDELSTKLEYHYEYLRDGSFDESDLVWVDEIQSEMVLRGIKELRDVFCNHSFEFVGRVW